MAILVVLLVNEVVIVVVGLLMYGFETVDLAIGLANVVGVIVWL